jgi:hypothetical protein
MVPLGAPQYIESARGSRRPPQIGRLSASQPFLARPPLLLLPLWLRPL